MFEQEMLAWSNESEELKRLVKQIQVENKKLKGIILKFEKMVLDYVNENERLRQENHHLAVSQYSSAHRHDESPSVSASDRDICYLTLKWLTYEVAQRTSASPGEQLFAFTTDESDRDGQQRFEETERQMRNVSAQNDRLRNQLESCTMQFKHLQLDMNAKAQEVSALKDEIER